MCSVRKADLCASRLCPKNGLLLGPNRMAGSPILMRSTSIVDSSTEIPSTVPLSLRDSSCPGELNPNVNSNASIVPEESKIALQTLVSDSLAQSIDGLFRCETLDRLHLQIPGRKAESLAAATHNDLLNLCTKGMHNWIRKRSLTLHKRLGRRG